MLEHENISFVEEKKAAKKILFSYLFYYSAFFSYFCLFLLFCYYQIMFELDIFEDHLAEIAILIVVLSSITLQERCKGGPVRTSFLSGPSVPF